MRVQSTISNLFLSISILSTTLPPPTSAQNSPFPKRGLAYINNPHPRDYRMLAGESSPLTWYYTWSPWPALRGSSLEFIPMLHGTSNTENDISSIKNLARGNTDVNHLLVFNEPDGSTSSGGSNIEPEDAARLWMDQVAELRGDPWNLQLSLPATTGSGRGLDWLLSFNESCFDLNPDGGCEFDFIATHWYGDFPSMASWLGGLNERYPGYEIWLTEFALPAASEEVTFQMMNQSLPFLDNLDYLTRYSWFGSFRQDDANEWTGDGVALMDHDGGLTQSGSLYLGGEEDGFEVGRRESGASHSRVDSKMPLAIALGTMMVLLC